MHRNRTLLLLFAMIVAALLVSSACATPDSDWLAASEIANALTLPEGSHVALHLEDIVKIKAGLNYIVLAEPFQARDRIICLMPVSPALRLGMSVNVFGDLVTIGPGIRALQNVTIQGFASESGQLLRNPPIIKWLPEFELTPWPWMIDLTAQESTSISMASRASTLSISSDEPNLDSAEGPTYYPTIADILNPTGTQTSGFRVQSYGIGDARGLPDNSLVYLDCKRIIASDVQTINGTPYGYIDVAEDTTDDSIRVFYSTNSSGTTVSPNERLHKLEAQVQHLDQDTPVLCANDGPSYDPQILEGSVSTVAPQRIAYARSLPDSGTMGLSSMSVRTNQMTIEGGNAELSGVVVSANQQDFPNTLYVQETNRSGGIRVHYTGTTVPRGNLVDVTGSIALAADGERKVDAGDTGVTVHTDPVQTVSPLGMTNKSLGGAAFDSNTPGVSNPAGSGVGLFNKGLLVRSWGTVTFVDSTNKFFYIDDGTGFVDGTTLDGNNDPVKGVRVSWAWPTGKPSIVPPAVGWEVSVTALSSSDTADSGTTYYRVLRPRDQNDIVVFKGGTPNANSPAPDWAEDVIPTDSCPAGESGPSSADSVDLATGAGENNPDPDIVVENPAGPNVEFARRYRSTLAEAAYSSPGLSPGWVHNYDTRVQGATGSWGDLTLVYSSGATDILRPVLSGNGPTGDFVPMGAPYIVTGQPGGATGQWDWICITFADESSWRFIAPNASDPDTYLLAQEADSLGHSIHINRVSTTDARLASVTDDSNNVLMSFFYSGGYLSTVSDVSVTDSSRDVTFVFAQEAGTTVLKSVSQVNNSMTLRWRYTYTAISGHPYLTWVEGSDPTGVSDMRGHSINYSSDGKVSSLVDANGNQRAYVYNGDSTQVFVRDSAGTVVEAWTQKIGPKNQDLGLVDADGHATSLEYTDDYRLWRMTNKNSQQTSFTYDGYGNVRTVTDPRGLVTTYDYADGSHPFRLTSVQTGTKTSTTYEYDANGQLWKINTPFPGYSGISDRVTTTYTYTALGNVSIVTAPAPNWNYGAVTTTVYDYTSDPDYGISGVTEKLGQPLRVSVYDGSPSSNQVLSRAHFRYDSRGRLEEVTDAVITADPDLRHRTNYAYDENDQVTDIWYPPTGSDYTKRAHLVYHYSCPGGPLQSMDLYDENGLLFRHVDATSGNEGEMLEHAGSVLQSSCAYDAMYRVRQITDGRSNTTRFDYNAVGNPTSIGNPSGHGTTWGFDADHNLNKRIDGLNRTINYTLDPTDSRVTDVTYAAGAASHINYDGYGRVTHMTDSTGAVDYTYDDNDLILTATTTYTGLAPKTVTYTYYPDGSRESMRISGLSGSPTSVTYRYYYAYDATYQGRRVGISVPWSGGVSINCYYDRNGQIVRQTTPYVNTNYSYNARGFRTQLLNQPIWTEGPESLFTDMLYDAAGNLTGFSYDMHIYYDYTRWQYGWSGTRLTGSVGFEYDELNRLTREQRAASDPSYAYDVDFSYDATDNIESSRGLSLSYNSDNQVGGYTYNSNGNVTSCRGYGFDYDCSDFPLSVTGGLSGTVSMQFRADGLRTSKMVGSTTHHYLYDGDKVVCDVDDSNQLARAYVYGPNGLVESAVYPNYPYIPYNTYMFDPLGSEVHTLYVAGPNPYVSRISGYDAYGKRCFDTKVPVPQGGPNANDPMGVGFVAQYGAFTDPETRPSDPDTPLVLMGMRYYDPITGRFLTRDPAGEGLNDYAYCANNPVMGVDPSGMGDVRWSTYWSDVGKVFKGEFNAVNPVNMYHGIKGLVNTTRKRGLRAAGSTLLKGTIRSYTGVFQLDDMERCGESTMVWTLTLSPAIKKIPSPLKGRAGASVVRATRVEAAIAGKITGYTKHGINQAISREGHGVSPKAILDAVKNPVKVVRQPKGVVQYVGKSAKVVLNDKGEVITVVAKTSKAFRVRR